MCSDGSDTDSQSACYLWTEVDTLELWPSLSFLFPNSSFSYSFETSFDLGFGLSLLNPGLSSVAFCDELLILLTRRSKEVSETRLLLEFPLTAPLVKTT